MPKVFATWVITVHPGMEQEFERFVSSWDPAGPAQEGTRLRILKGERGGLGKYLLLNEFDSVETRDRYFPSRTQASKEAEEAARSEGFQKFISFVEERDDADWIALFEHN